VEIFYASGKIEKISGFNLYHTTKTEGGSFCSALMNDDMKVVGIHRSLIIITEKEKQITPKIATNFSAILNAVKILYHKRYVYNIENALKLPRVLSTNEKNHGLKETSPPNIYINVPFLNQLRNVYYFIELIMDGIIKKKEKINKLEYLKLDKWILIHPYKPVEEVINAFKHIEHQHKLIIMWLRLSELIYM